MKKNAESHPTRYHLSDARNGAYLAACPVDVVRMSFWLDTGLRRKIMKLTVRNRGTRAVTAMTVYAHYMNNSFRNIGDAEGFIELKFTGLYCRPGKCTELPKFVRLAYQDIAAADLFVVAVTYEDGGTEEFQPEDYVVLPRRPLLNDVLSADDCALVRRRYGKRAVYVPSVPQDGVTPWQCACGAADPPEDRRCSCCGLSRSAARTLSTERGRAHAVGRIRAAGILLRVIPVLLAGILLIVAGVYLWNRFDAFINSTPFGWRTPAVTEAAGGETAATGEAEEEN